MKLKNDVQYTVQDQEKQLVFVIKKGLFDIRDDARAIIKAQAIRISREHDVVEDKEIPEKYLPATYCMSISGISTL